MLAREKIEYKSKKSGINSKGIQNLNFRLSEKQILIRNNIRRFCERVLKPYAHEIDNSERISDLILKELSHINAWGIEVPEKYGGANLDSISYAIIIEELSKYCASTGLTVSVHNSLGIYPLLKWGTIEQKEKYLYDAANGKSLMALAITEPNAGSDIRAIESCAVQSGGNFILNGSKIFVTNGGLASLFLIAAKFKAENGTTGIEVFIAEKNMEGVEIGDSEHKMGIRGSSTTSLYFKDVIIPKENILGTLNEGLKIISGTLDAGRIGIASQALGIAQAAFERAVEYSKSRKQFNRTISSFEGISFKLAEMATMLEAARLLTYKTAFLKDINNNFTKEAAMCKYFASKIARKITNKALQIHGGYGYMKDLPLERYYRDAKVCEIYEGTNEIMKLIISQQILRGNM
ncbi:MAG: acyl-CoA dehydrogenase family protein [Promethearchaeota archaeon]